MPAVVSEMVQVHVFRRALNGVCEFLILQRASGEEIYPDMWQPVTGSIEHGETAAHAARREVLEETGLECPVLLAVPYIASFYSVRKDEVHMVPVFAAEVSHDAEVVLSHEHQDFVWLPRGEAHELLVFPGHREGLRVLSEYVLAPVPVPVVVHA